jgi:predicted aspartyl protease
MQLFLKDDLPFTSIKLEYRDKTIEVTDVLIDTGSASTILSADIVAQIGITPEPSDSLHIVRGVGGTEVVFTRQIDRLQIDQQSLTKFEIEVGGMDYGFGINGILGMDFLTRAGAVINLCDLKLEFLSK